MDWRIVCYTWLCLYGLLTGNDGLGWQCMGAELPCPFLISLEDVPSELLAGVHNLTQVYTTRLQLRSHDLRALHPEPQIPSTCGSDLGDQPALDTPTWSPIPLGALTLGLRFKPLPATSSHKDDEHFPEWTSGQSKWVRGRFNSEERTFVISYQEGDVSSAWHGVGRLMSDVHTFAPTEGDDVGPPTCRLPGDFTLTTSFQMTGVMLDLSRGKVLKLEAMRTFLMTASLAGFSHVLLYMEDTFEVEGQEMFGYGRGRYTVEELRQADQVAKTWGIELVACIQTLGHLEQVLKWPQYSGLRSSRARVHMDSEPSLTFLNRMIEVIANTLSSRRIHIGMDEPFGVDSYSQSSLSERRFAVRRHLKRVVRLCQAHGLRPLAYADPLLRMYSDQNNYYDPKVPPISQADVQALPEGMDLVYWDYYHTHHSHYSNMMTKHLPAITATKKNPAPFKEAQNSTALNEDKLDFMSGRNLVAAAGAWSWNRLWTALPWAYRTMDPLVHAAKQQGVKQVYVCVWMDDGAEVDFWSIIPALTFFAARAWAPLDVPLQEVKEVSAKLAQAVAAVNVHNYVVASGIDVPPGVVPDQGTTNMAKWLLWEDPLLGHLSPQLQQLDLSSYFIEIYNYLSDKIQFSFTDPLTGYTRDMALEYAQRVALALALKTRWQEDVRSAYATRNIEEMKTLVNLRMLELQGAVHSLWKAHRGRWLYHFKPQGLEVLEMRYGTLRTRLETARDRLKFWIAEEGKSTLEELSERRVVPFPHLDLNNLPTLCWASAATPATPSVCHESLCPLL